VVASSVPYSVFVDYSYIVSVTYASTLSAL